ncbi:MAG: hypothetical protein WBD00_00390 [Candidatus Omnitrophota bacterium]
MTFLKKSLIVLGVLFYVACAEAQNRSDIVLNITADVDKDQVNIGDRIKLDVKAEGASGYDLIFPEEMKDLGDFSLKSSSPIEEGRGKKIVGREYILGVYSTGIHVIPPVEVMYRKESKEEWHAAKSPQVPIDVRSLLTGKDTDIKDLKGLAAFGGGFPRALIVLVVLIAIAAVIWLLWKRRAAIVSAQLAEEKSAYEIAHEELNHLKAEDLPGQGRVKEYYTQLADIIRHYLERRFSYRAPEMTTEEFMGELKKSPLMMEEHKSLLKDFLSRCDMVKFAKYGPTPLEMIDSFKSAEQMVEQTHEEEQPEEVEA